MATKDSADVQVVPGPEASWTGQKTQGIVSSRSHTIIYPKAGGNFQQGNKIRIEIPSQDYWDTSLFTISMRTRLFCGAGVHADTGRTAEQAPAIFGQPNVVGSDPNSATNSHWVTLRNGAQSLFNRVRILQGSMVIADVTDYNKLNRVLRICSTEKDHQATIDFINEGVYDPDVWEQKKMARNFFSSAVADSNEGHFFNIRLNTGFLDIDKYFPTKYTGQITFELYMESNENCLVSSVIGEFSSGGLPSVPTADVDPNTAPLSYPNASYMVDDVQAHVHFVVPIAEYDEEMLSSIESQGLTVMFNTWREHSRQIIGAGKSVHSFQERAVSVKGGLAIMENNIDLGDRRSDWHFPSNNIQRFQWKLGNMYVPSQPVETMHGAGRAITELEDFLNITGDPTASWLLDASKYLSVKASTTTANVSAGASAGASCVRKTWENFKEMRAGQSLPNSFVMALNLEKSPGQLSGFNTSASNVDIELRLELASQDTLPDMPASTGRNATQWAGNNSGHIFQPSKFKCHDRTAAAGGYWFSGEQPDDRTFSGEGQGLYYSANELGSSVGCDAAGAPQTNISQADIPARSQLLKPLNRFPESDLADLGAGADNGGITSTSFMYTKDPSTYSLLSFWANVDAQLDIIKVGQLRVLS